MAFYEWLADGASDVTRSFIVFATISLATFAVLLGFAIHLVLQTAKALRDERRSRRSSID